MVAVHSYSVIQCIILCCHLYPYKVFVACTSGLLDDSMQSKIEQCLGLTIMQCRAHFQGFQGGCYLSPSIPCRNSASDHTINSSEETRIDSANNSGSSDHHYGFSSPVRNKLSLCSLEKTDCLGMHKMHFWSSCIS